VVLRHKGMLERTTSAEAECSVLRIRECGDIVPQKVRDKGSLMLFCLRFDDAVGMDDSAVRQTAGIPPCNSVLLTTAASKPIAGVAALVGRFRRNILAGLEAGLSAPSPRRASREQS
jgi:hypothetical protein